MSPYRQPSPPSPDPPKCEGDSACYRDVRCEVWLTGGRSAKEPFRMCEACAKRYHDDGWNMRLAKSSRSSGC